MPISLKESPASSSVDGKIKSAEATPISQLSSTALVIRGSSQRHDEENYEEEGAAQLTVAVGGGLRIDPFNAFPTSNSKTVNMMVDYRELIPILMVMPN